MGNRGNRRPVKDTLERHLALDASILTESAVFAGLLLSKSWLYPGESALVESMRRQFEAGKGLSDRQYSTLVRILERAERRRVPRVFRG